MSGAIQFPPTHQLSLALQRRTERRLKEMTDDEIYAYLADTIYTEKRRIENGDDDASGTYLKAIHNAARAIKKDRHAMSQTLLDIVDIYVKEVHNNFSPRTYDFASKVLPGALTRLLTAAQPSQLLGGDFDPGSRIVVQGPTQKLRELSRTHTLIFTPTHFSNLDSPLIGFALLAAKLPPVIYGAGLNLFANPLMAFFMSRLGAYTVDRRKKNTLYKDVLKDYSIEAIRRKCPSLFFPGGTRSRSGKLENRLKKGLLGTGITAWQESLAEKQSSEVLIVPCTLSYSLTLEAETMIQDALAEEEKTRFIITDDEFSEARTVATFGRKALNLDASVFVRFGEPMDIVGNPVDTDGCSIDPNGQRIDRKEYVLNRYGQVLKDPQRDQAYTDALSGKILKAYRRDNIALSTHITGFCASELLRHRHPRLDNVQRALLRPEDRRLERVAVLTSIDRVHNQILELSKKERICEALPGNASDILQEALTRFSTFHRRRALTVRKNNLEINSNLCLYYGNRLKDYGLVALGEG